jgi:hypothetical protein
MPYRTLQVTVKPQPLYVGKPLNATAQLGVGWTLANNDQTNAVYVSTSPGVKSTDSDAIQVAPLGSIPIDPTFTSYIVSAGPSVQCFLMPGGGTWAPSPAQIAAQINALGLAKNTTLAAQTTGATIAADVGNTGVPLLTKSTVIFSNLSHVIAQGATWQAFINSTLSKPTYEIFIALGTLAADAQPWAKVQLSWNDSTSNTQVAQQEFCLAVGTTTAIQYHGIGPIHADQLSVFVISLSATNSMTVGLIVLNNSNPALYELWRQETTAAVNGAGLGFANADLQSNYLAGITNAAIAAGGNDFRLLPLYTGLPIIIQANTSSNTTDLEIRMLVPASLITALGLTALLGGGNNTLIANSDAKGIIQTTYSLPRMMLQHQIINHNAAAKDITRLIAGTV